MLGNSELAIEVATKTQDIPCIYLGDNLST